MRDALPRAAEVFARYFERWYEGDDRVRRHYPALRPLIEEFPVPLPAALIDGQLAAEDRERVAAQIAEMRGAIEGDWPELLGVTGALSLGWLDAFDRAYDREEVAQVLTEANPEEFDNELVVLACELGVATGEVLRALVPDVVWVYHSPYWDSAVLDPRSGLRANVFAWALAKLSEDGVAGGYADGVGEFVRRAAARGAARGPVA